VTLPSWQGGETPRASDVVVLAMTGVEASTGVYDPNAGSDTAKRVGLTADADVTGEAFAVRGYRYLADFDEVRL
jgi:hypothetical protein